MQLSIIIVNYNVKYFLEHCLCSVIKASREMEAEVFVVDNNSTDGSKAFFAGRFPNVKFIWLEVNNGFSKANNIALKKATGEHILFLNPDTIIPEDCLEKCLSFFESRAAIGAVGVHMIDGSGAFLRESKRAFPSPLTSLFKFAGLASAFPASGIFARYYLGNLDEKTDQEVDVLAGAFMMVRKSVLDEVGGFDEDFFMYGEDVDLSYRVQKAGYQNFYFAGTTIIHFKGESTKKETAHYVKLFYGAMSLFVKKHYAGGVAGAYRIFIELGIRLKASFFSLGNKLKPSVNKNERVRDLKPTLLVGNQQEFENIKEVVLKADVGHLVIGRISPQLKSENALGSLGQLNSVVKTYKVKEIIFCTNDVAIKEVISIIQQLSPEINYWFHLADTVSIVGSSKRNFPGFYMVKD